MVLLIPWGQGETDSDLQVDLKYLHQPIMKVILRPSPKLSLGPLDLYSLVSDEGNVKELVVLDLNLRFEGKSPHPSLIEIE